MLISVLMICAVAKMSSLFRDFRCQDILKVIHIKASKVEMSARNVQDGLVVENYLVTKEVEKTTTRTEGKVEQMQESVRGLDNKIQEVDAALEKLNDLLSNQINDALASKNSLYQMLESYVSGKPILTSFEIW